MRDGAPTKQSTDRGPTSKARPCTSKPEPFTETLQTVPTGGQTESHLMDNMFFGGLHVAVGPDGFEGSGDARNRVLAKRGAVPYVL